MNSTEMPVNSSDLVSNFTVHPELSTDMVFGTANVISIVGYGSLFVVSSIANLTVLKILMRRYKKTKSRVNLLLLHLAVADLVVTFMMMPLEISWAATVKWLAGDALCRILSFFRIFGLFLSSNILICISIDRFYAIVCPLSTGKAAQIMKILLATAWIVAILSALPQVYVFHVETHPDFPSYTQCVTFHSFPSDAWQTAYTIFGSVMIYLIPLVVIVVTYAIILITIIKKSKSSGAEGINGEGLRRSGAGVLNRARARTLKMTIVIVAVFILCWTPYYVSVIWFLFDKPSFQELDQRIQKILFIFACVNSVMDPIVYGFFNLRKNKTRRSQQPILGNANDHGAHGGSGMSRREANGTSITVRTNVAALNPHKITTIEEQDITTV